MASQTKAAKRMRQWRKAQGAKQGAKRGAGRRAPTPSTRSTGRTVRTGNASSLGAQVAGKASPLLEALCARTEGLIDRARQVAARLAVCANVAIGSIDDIGRNETAADSPAPSGRVHLIDYNLDAVSTLLAEAEYQIGRLETL
jgi:hypothetical protein